MSRHVWEAKCFHRSTVDSVLELLPDRSPKIPTWPKRIKHLEDNPSLDRLEQYGSAFLCAALEWHRQKGAMSSDSLYNILCRPRKFKPGTFDRPEYQGRMWRLFWPHLEEALPTPTAITAEKLSGLIAADRIEETGGNLVHARFLRVLANEPDPLPLGWALQRVQAPYRVEEAQ